MKKILLILAVLVVLVVGGIVALVAIGLSQVDKIAKTSVEYGGTYAMGVETTVESVDVGVTSGTVEMGSLNIANPEGFDTDHFFKLGSANASLDLNSLSQEAIIIPSVKLVGLDVILDKGNDPSNYNQILENLKRFESDETTPDESKEGKNIIINSLILEDINIHVANMPGVELLAGDVAINIPQIELQNIGSEEKMKAGDIFNLVIKTVLAAAVEAGGGIIPGDVLGELGNGLGALTSLGDMGIDAITDLDLDGALGNVGEQVEEVLGDLEEQGQKAIDDASEAVDDAVNDAADQLKGLFGGKEDDDG